MSTMSTASRDERTKPEVVFVEAEQAAAVEYYQKNSLYSSIL